MMRQFMESADLTFWPVLAMVVFICYLILLMLWLWRVNSGNFYKEMGRMVLAGDDFSAKGDEVGNGRKQ